MRILHIHACVYAYTCIYIYALRFCACGRRWCQTSENGKMCLLNKCSHLAERSPMNVATLLSQLDSCQVRPRLVWSVSSSCITRQAPLPLPARRPWTTWSRSCRSSKRFAGDWPKRDRAKTDQDMRTPIHSRKSGARARKSSWGTLEPKTAKPKLVF